MLREIKVECPHAPPLNSLYSIVVCGVETKIVTLHHHNILSRTGATGATGAIRNTARQPQPELQDQLELRER